MNQDLSGENCHCLPKHPQYCCFLLLGLVLQFMFYCFSWDRASAVKNVSFSLVVWLSLPSCADKEAEPEVNIWLLCRCPAPPGLSLDIHSTGVELALALLLLSHWVGSFLSSSDSTDWGGTEVTGHIARICVGLSQYSGIKFTKFALGFPHPPFVEPSAFGPTRLCG